MGHKGANKLKPKKSKLLPNQNLNLSSIAHSGSNSGQSLAKNNGTGRADKNPVAGLSKNKKPGK